ncbi:MAG: carbamoyltransferase HypF, partial [Candidatus Thorarchaeota archaeon]
ACGPRFSTITDLPYDRPNTTMHDFPLCNACNTGYTSPLDRRYHAQTTACENCGPQYRLFDANGRVLEDIDPVSHTAHLIESGSIIALQGISGTHLVTKTSDVSPIRKLRERKRRFQQPFAIMVRNRETLLHLASPTPKELEFLETWRRPIVLVRKPEENLMQASLRPSFEEISPGLDTLGVMLPYTPLHYLLFDAVSESALVMTSANHSGIPMYIDPSVISSELSDIADYFLLHDRRIHQRADDSVIKFVRDESPVFIRRARGYVPEPLAIRGVSPSLRLAAVGPEEKATGAILKSKRIYMTQHIGDTNHVESIEFLREALEHLMGLLGLERIDGYACDLHPEFLSTELAEQLSTMMRVPLFRVQHHHAHLAGLLVDHDMDVNTNIVCITADGYGYSPDGNGWGGDILVGSGKSYLRKGGLASSTYPGGDLSARYAVRSLVGILGRRTDASEVLKEFFGNPIGSETSINEETLPVLLQSQIQKVNTLESTSTGRFLDGVAVALGICSENSYDGECPMKLEAYARESDSIIEPNFVSRNSITELDSVESLMQIIDLKRKGVPVSRVAYAAQTHIGLSLAEMACNIADSEGIEVIGFSGGVALNRIITRVIVDTIISRGKTPLIHRKVPPGDAGVSVGQISVATAQLEKN